MKGKELFDKCLEDYDHIEDYSNGDIKFVIEYLKTTNPNDLIEEEHHNSNPTFLAFDFIAKYVDNISSNEIKDEYIELLTKTFNQVLSTHHALYGPEMKVISLLPETTFDTLTDVLEYIKSATLDWDEHSTSCSILTVIGEDFIIGKIQKILDIFSEEKEIEKLVYSEYDMDWALDLNTLCDQHPSVNVDISYILSQMIKDLGEELTEKLYTRLERELEELREQYYEDYIVISYS